MISYQGNFNGKHSHFHGNSDIIPTFKVCLEDLIYTSTSEILQPQRNPIPSQPLPTPPRLPAPIKPASWGYGNWQSRNGLHITFLSSQECSKGVPKFKEACSAFSHLKKVLIEVQKIKKIFKSHLSFMYLSFLK